MATCEWLIACHDAKNTPAGWDFYGVIRHVPTIRFPLPVAIAFGFRLVGQANEVVPISLTMITPGQSNEITLKKDRVTLGPDGLSDFGTKPFQIVFRHEGKCLVTLNAGGQSPPLKALTLPIRLVLPT